ncbi:hypothetical protein LE181_25605 [Streptomyces sp. SCA3-4]|uniref:hypothetical protein n=1 Tax=Streptomyces sichuanensis TaxID=2871810 RepID=UPI001CE23825|nr:hypothetical protein [Streptomyces sichuanensis]MCA6095528.1 hypothetical protein [Streptomyces sichuanensis]
MLRAIRDLVIALLGLTLAIATRAGGNSAKTSWIIWGCWIFIGAVALCISHWCLPNGDNRHARNPKLGLWALETEVLFLHAPAAILLFTGAFYGLGQLTANLSENTEKYWFGAASGFILAGLSAAIINPGKDIHWVENHVKKRLGKAFKKYFGRRDDHGTLLRKTVHSRWQPDGIESHALDLKNYDDQSGRRVSGWRWKYRRYRCETLIAGLSKSVIPEQGIPAPAPKGSE